MAADSFPEVNLANLDFTRLVADGPAIEAINPHRGPMKMLTGVVHLDTQQHLIIGFKDVAADEFWAAGHFPDYPVLPGVLMCEAAAQLANFYTISQSIIPREKLVGLGGIDESRFREPVRPGDRLILAAKGLRLSTRMTRFQARGFVRRGDDYRVAFETAVVGVPIGTWEDLRRA